jgi:hypothetical protein
LVIMAKQFHRFLWHKLTALTAVVAVYAI